MGKRINLSKVVQAALLIGIVVGGLVVSYRAGFREGRETARQDAVVPMNSMVVAGHVSNLSTAVKALRAAVKDPQAFDPTDLRFFRYVVQSSADVLETEIVPGIRRAEEAERRREPDRTLEDEERRIQHIRELVREGVALDKALVGRVPGE